MRATDPLTKAALLVLGLGATMILAVALLVSTTSARKAHDAASEAAALTTTPTPDSIMHNMSAAAATAPAASAQNPLESFAGAVPAGASLDTLAMRHGAFPASLPAAAAGPVAHVRLTVVDKTIQIAPGVSYRAWTFNGSVPGPVIHVRQGQMVHVTLVNGGSMPHSLDFHAARVAPDRAFAEVLPGKSIHLRFRASDAGAFMYHCGTAPALMHIANGMYGAIVVDPARPLPHADRSYVLVGSEWYLDGSGTSRPAGMSLEKAHARIADWVTWNGYSRQYVSHPLSARPGDWVRFYVVDAGPSLDTDFHVVGSLLDRAYIDADVAHHLSDVQTAAVPAGGGGIFDVHAGAPGLYPFVSHSFASVDLGQAGVLRVGHVAGTMSH